MSSRRRLYETGTYIVLSLAAAVIVGTILIIAAYCIPTSVIREHVKDSLRIYQRENCDYGWAPAYFNSWMDNWTDSIILNEAIFHGTGSVVQDAMNNSYVTYDNDSSPAEMLIYIAQYGGQDGDTVNYARYWHGNLAILMPLLYFCNMSDIRMLNFCLQFTLVIWLLIELYEAGGYRLVLPAGAALLVLNPIATAMCMQYSDIYIITLGGALTILRRYRNSSTWRVFLWIGIATAYFDFLTYPLVGLGFNLLLLLYLNRAHTLLHQLRRVVDSSFSWAFGYAAMWIAKWLIASILTGTNVIAEGIQNVQYRSGADMSAYGGSVNVSAWDVVLKNMNEMLIKPYILAGVLVLVVILLVAIRKGGRIRRAQANVLPFAIVGVYPFVWFILVRNHSAAHYWMTHRILSITIMAVGLIVACIYQTQEQSFDVPTGLSFRD